MFRHDLDEFNLFAVKTITDSNSNVFMTDNIKIYECEVNVAKKKLLPIKRKKDTVKNGDSGIFEVGQKLKILWLWQWEWRGGFYFQAQITKIIIF
jgi:hypothetical protein